MLTLNLRNDKIKFPPQIKKITEKIVDNSSGECYYNQAVAKKMRQCTLTNEQQCNPENSTIAMSNAKFAEGADTPSLLECGWDESKFDSAKHVTK